MNSTAATLVPSGATHEHATLEGLLIGMTKYGRPRVTKHAQGWSAAIEVNTVVPGADFEIRSSFDHPSPLSAARECHERLQNALTSYGTKP